MRERNEQGIPQSCEFSHGYQELGILGRRKKQVSRKIISPKCASNPFLLEIIHLFIYWLLFFFGY